MAKLLNVKRATYGEYERGNNLPPIDKLKIIANSFSISVDYLIGLSEPELINITDTLENLLVNLNRIKDVPERAYKLVAASLEHTLNVVEITKEWNDEK